MSELATIRVYSYNDVQLNNGEHMRRVATLSEQLKKLRKELKMSQREFCELVQETSKPYQIAFGGIKGQGLVSGYETNRYCPKSETKWAICNAADIDMEVLTGYKNFNSRNRFDRITVPFEMRHPEWAVKRARATARKAA